MRFLAVLLIALMTTTMAHAELYRCTDSNGAVTFADRPCPGSKQEVVEMKYKYDKTDLNKLPSVAVKPTYQPAPKAEVAPALSAPAPAATKQVLLEDRLASLCVDVYRKHLAYPNGVQIKGRTLERSLSEMHIIVNVRTITNPATPTHIDPIFLNEKFICVTDFGAGLHERNTSFYVDRHKKGERL